MPESGRTVRRLPVGAEVQPGGGAHFRVWAPKREAVEVELDDPDGGGAAFALEAERNGYFSGHVASAGAGTRYRYRLDGGDAYPDPASRFQPDGPHGPSAVVDPSGFAWTDEGWTGIALDDAVVYELHVGTFTPEGTWAAAAGQLPALAELGVTVIEMMPIADFDGRFGWGYDGVDLFAPTRNYGTPDDLRRFIDRAHALDIGVVLDVVYNHFGPSGNYLAQYADAYFTDRHTTDWGEAINFDGPEAGPVRDFFTTNAAYWIDEFHFDGLRFDATQNLYDDSDDHILAALARAARRAAPGRTLLLAAENEPQEARLVRAPERGGYGLDALWNDDFHHAAVVALTGHNEAYYSDYHGTPQELISAVRWGYLYQGQFYRWQKQRRGAPALDLELSAFVHYLENHDQVANSGRGERLDRRTSPGRLRALTALLLLAPETPLLFQGQEFAASAPFLFFADHEPELARAVHAGRRDFLAQFRSLATPEAQARVPDPADPATFERCKLDHRERTRGRHAESYALHRELLRLRREDETIRAARRDDVHGAVLGAEAFLLRFFGRSPEEDRLLLINLGRDLELSPAPEPLLAPPGGSRWAVLWSSEDPRYGGLGTATPETEDAGWRLPGHAALLLAPDAGPPATTTLDT
jgi:maltooligosyltrehalose trehalohydrolase